MTNEQLYLAIGVPSFVALIGIVINVALYIHLSTRTEGRFVSMDARFDHLAARLETLTVKVVEIYNRVIRIEDKLGIVPR